MTRDDHAPHASHLGPGLRVDVLPEHGVVLFVQADRLADGDRFTAGVVDHRVDIRDLAEAVTPELEARRHEPQTPFADVERGAPVVVEAGVTVGDDHLGERHPVGDVALAAMVVVAHLVDDRAFAEVEAEPHGPVLPAQQGALESERATVGLGDVQRLEVVSQCLLPQGGGVLTVDGGHPVVVLVLDVENLKGGEVDDDLQTRDRVGVGVAVRRGADPQVGPAESSVAPLWRHQLATVGPDVDDDERGVGDATAGQGRQGALVQQDGVGDVVELVDREVAGHPRDDRERLHRLGREVDRGLDGLVAGAIQQHDGTTPVQGITGPPGSNGRLGRLDRRDGDEPPGRVDARVATEQRRHRADLVRREGVERVSAHRIAHGGSHLRSGRWAPAPVVVLILMDRVGADKGAAPHTDDAP